MKHDPTAQGKTGLMKIVVADVFVLENINAVRELIMQDRHRTYREIEASLSIYSTSIHFTLHKHMRKNKFVYLVGSRIISQSLKKGSCGLVQRNL